LGNVPLSVARVAELNGDNAIRAVQPLPSGPFCVLGNWCESLPGDHLYYAKSPTANVGFPIILDALRYRATAKERRKR